MNAKQLWQAALDHVRTRVAAASYATWFKATEGIELDDLRLVVAVPNSFASEHLRQRFLPTATEAVADVLGRPLEIVFVVRSRGPNRATASAGQMSGEPSPVSASHPIAQSDTPPPPRPSPAGAAQARRRTSPATAARPGRRERAAVLDAPRTPKLSASRRRSGAQYAAQPALPEARPDDSASPMRDHTLPSFPQHPARGLPESVGVSTSSATSFSADPGGHHVFDAFIVGTANRLAYAAAREVAAAPGRSYNPLFIYGGTGLGKTHLLLAIGHVARLQSLSVCYVSAERFTNEIIEAIRHHTTDEFRAIYRSVDVLLVDDIQFIAGKESTEEEFFHTFNALHDAGKQVVLSSDRTPRAMHRLHDRLRSRFEWGLLADIQPPDIDHQRDILRAKAASQRVHLPDAVVEAIARPECASVRELEGALNRVLAHAKMLGQPVDVELVARALGPIRTSVKRELSGDEVVAVVARHFGVTVEALRGKGRDHATSWPRQVAMYLMREATPASLCQIGQILGGRDHTTIMHGCAHVTREVAAKDHVRRELDDVRAALRQ